jgi:exopolysaccharide biosynthesis protein
MRYILFLLIVSIFAQTAPIEYFSKNVSGFNVKGVKINLCDPKIKIKLGLAQGKVGRTESLEGIAKRNDAKVAINGSFFDAYSNSDLKNPDMSLIRNGNLVFKSNIGSIIGFNSNNIAVIARVKYSLWGEVISTEGKTRNWHAYWINRKPTSSPCITIFTPDWGPNVQYYGGSMVVVSSGKVTSIRNQSVAIPPDGFVINIIGDSKLLSYFTVNSNIKFTPKIEVDGCEQSVWENVVTGVGGGPRVLINGKTQFSPSSELFSDPKILELSGARSAIGFTQDNMLVLITTSKAKVRDLGIILKSLGCINGMNLDGGASSGLWYDGKLIVTPGRQISNALCISVKN